MDLGPRGGDGVLGPGGRLSGASIERPVIILALPRTGSTMLFDALAQSPSLYTIGDESHGIIEGIPALRAASHGFESSRLTAADATPENVDALLRRFLSLLRDRDGKKPATGPVRMLEKTPRNVLRVPFLQAVFPDAYYIYLHRDPRATISSMIDAWQSGTFHTYLELPGWRGQPWSLLLIPGWRNLIGKPLAEIVAAQWATTIQILLDDLQSISPQRLCTTSYSAILEDPQREIQRLCAFADLDWDRPIDKTLPISRTALTPPDAAKVERNARELAVAMPLVEEAIVREGRWVGGGAPRYSRVRRVAIRCNDEFERM